MRPVKRIRGFRLVAVIRVLALALACLSVALVLLFQVSRARAGDVLTELGAQLMRLEDVRYRNGVQRLTINGMTLAAIQVGALQDTFLISVGLVAIALLLGLWALVQEQRTQVKLKMKVQ
jgi:hypothetical protein